MKATTASLHLLRSDAVFQRIYYEKVTICTELDIPLPELPRQRRAPSRFSGPASSHVPTSAFVFYRVHCFEFIDSAISALERRYSQPGITKYTQLESVLLREYTQQEIADVVIHYPELNVDHLHLQLRMIRDQKWNIQSVVELLNKLLSSDPALRAMFDEVDVLTRLLLTIPASSAEAERIFSGLRRSKTYLNATR